MLKLVSLQVLVKIPSDPPWLLVWITQYGLATEVGGGGGGGGWHVGSIEDGWLEGSAIGFV